MIDGSKQYTLNGVVPILAVISLVYAIQLIVRSVQRRRRERVEADRLQREQEAVQAQQEADAASVYPVAGGTYAGGRSVGRVSDRQPVRRPVRREPEPAAAEPGGRADRAVPGRGFDQTRQFPEDIDAPRQLTPRRDGACAAPTATRTNPARPLPAQAEGGGTRRRPSPRCAGSADPGEAPAEPEVKEAKTRGKAEPAAAKTKRPGDGGAHGAAEPPEVKRSAWAEQSLEVKEASPQRSSGARGQGEPAAAKPAVRRRPSRKAQAAGPGRASRRSPGRAAASRAGCRKEQVGSSVPGADGRPRGHRGVPLHRVRDPGRPAGGT